MFVYMTVKMCSGCFNSRVCVHILTQMMIILLTVSCTHAGYSWPAAAQHSRDFWREEDPMASASATASGVSAVALPVFDITPSSRGLTVLVGQTALLPCVVRNLGDKVVSWIRPRDLHILTSGIYVFTTDSRMEVVHAENTDFWGLRIRNTQLMDTGKYECQVNTDPKMNYAMTLTVTYSHMHESSSKTTLADNDNTAGSASSGSGVTIQGPSEQYVRVGSTITFTCMVSRTTPTPPTPLVTHPLVSRAQLKWTHASRDVTFQSSRGGISVDTDYRDDRITSALTVALVTLEDAGEYTCHDLDAYADVKMDTVTLVVVEGEHTEAMQRDPPNGAFPTQKSLLPFFFVYFNWILR